MTPGYMASHVRIWSLGRVSWPYTVFLTTTVVAAMMAGCDASDELVSTSRDAAPPEQPDDAPLGGAAETNPSHSIAASYLVEARFADADFERGELLSYACIVCHTLRPGEEHLIGPNLNGIFGRPAASAADFAYSDALQAAEIVWTPVELDAWLARPDDFVPGNLMVFAGIYSISDRTDLLAYLLRETAADQSATTQ